MTLLPLKIILASLVTCCVADWPDVHKRTQGMVWPAPKVLQDSKRPFPFDPRLVKVVTSYSCDILTSALASFSRKTNIALSHSGNTNVSLVVCGLRQMTQDRIKASSIELHVTVVDNLCPDSPQMGMAEDYNITTNSSIITLQSTAVWGAVRGLETLSQLVYSTDKGLMMKTASVQDAPRFEHRGLLLDTSRHFFSIDVIKAIIELCAENKLNIFHWHLTDIQSFPFRPTAYPQLAKGAFDERHIYSQHDIKTAVSFARLRGVRVLLEVDTPGHAYSWGVGIPSIVSRCFDTLGRESLDRSMLDPTNPLTFDVLTSLFKELFSLFPERIVHLGGDEASFWISQCWENNKNVSDYMRLWGMNSTRDLEQHYFNRLIDHLTARDMPKRQFMVWQEVLDEGIKLNEIIGHVWKGNTRKEQQDSVRAVIKSGHLAVLSSCWYLDHISWNMDVVDYYNCDPQDLEGVTAIERSRVIGGEVAMWGEMVDASNVIPRIFPRASAVAEKLWSSEDFTRRTNATAEWPRLYEWSCRMAERGFPSQPGFGPGFCPWEYVPALPQQLLHV